MKNIAIKYASLTVLSLLILSSFVASGINSTHKSDNNSNDFITNQQDNHPPIFYDEYPKNRSISISIDRSFLSVNISDLEGDLFNWSIETSLDIGNVSGNYSTNGTKSCPIHTPLDYDTNYTWYVNATDYNGSGNFTRKIFTFRTESRPNQENYPPLIYGEDPTYASISVSVDRSFLSVNISDLEGDLFNWSIETSPDIGSNSSNDSTNGTKFCDISGLKPNTGYTWFVNATDYNGSGNWTRRTLLFWTATNGPPILSVEDPVNNSNSILVDRSFLSVNISDLEGDLFNWSIETSPDIGSNSSNGDSDGKKICRISGLKPAAKYTWYVNVTDFNGSGNWNREYFVFNTESPPNKPKNPDPENNQINVCRRPILFVKVNDPDNDLMNVSFYFSDGSLIGYDYNVSKLDRWAVYSIDEYLEYNTTYSWYAVANDSKYSNRSKTWNFTTWSEEYKNSLLEISFPKRLYCSCVKSDIKNNFEENILDANWSISINGGIFNGINITKQGIIDIDSGDTIMISTRDLSLRDRIIRNFGLINVTINVNAYDSNFIRYSKGLVLGRFVFLFGN